jgi:hypothetical protein
MPRGGTESVAEQPVIGWREWVRLPGLLALPIKAKIDSGARTSSIHAFGTRRFVEGGAPMVEFLLHPLQRRRAASGSRAAIPKPSKPLKPPHEDRAPLPQPAALLAPADHGRRARARA